MSKQLNILLKLLFAVIVTLAGRQAAWAFSTDTYATGSVLAQGRWVKVSVDCSGLYILSNSALRSMGFSNPARVRVYGYGAQRIADQMTRSSYIDDLPPAPQQLTDKGIVFYALGPETWVRSGTTSFYHAEPNLYSSFGYYFVTELDEAPEATSTVTAETSHPGAGSSTPAEVVYGRVHYEQERVMATEAGPLMVGEDFRFTSSRQFTFKMPGRVPGSDVWLESQFVATHVGVPSQLKFTADGKDLPAVTTDRISATSDSHYVHASIGTSRRTFVPSGPNPESMVIGVSHSCSGVVTRANLDYLSVNYRRRLELPAEGHMIFWANERALSLKGAGADLEIWDVTVPTSVARVSFELQGQAAVWTPSYTAMRSYVAWKPGAALPEPKVVGRVSNQNIHGDTSTPEMVIITPAALMSQAGRIAELHRSADGMEVTVIDAALIYNEFASGAADVSALRKYLKMLYDRGNEAGKPLRYALLLGRTTLDHRNLAASTAALGYTTLPAWVNREARHSMNDNDGYTTDDFIAMLGDNSGKDHGLDNLSIAVGRIPMMSENDGIPVVDKLIQYVNSSKRSSWKNRIMVLADDEDQGVHLRQAESMISKFLVTEGQQHLIDKVYLDAYTKSSGAYPDARREMFSALDEGVAWWFFTGHANNHSWTGDGQLTYTDINNMYLRNLPFVVASTCDFLRWDSETTSGGEIMFKERYGGAIAMISATRPVYISDNGYYLEALGRALLARDDDGRLMRAGEIYRRSKNDILNSKGQHTSNPNRLRFVFMGDPALRVVTPDNIVELLTIDGQPVELEAQLTMAAMANVTVTGRVTDPAGNLLENFDGVVYVDIYDALTSVTTNGNGNGRVEVFDRHGDKLYAGSARVKNGLFTLNVAMPQMVADNFRPATMSMYAFSDGPGDVVEAIGTNSEFYVYGFDEPDTPDTVAPSIDLIYLNHADFKSGDRVNSSPVLMAAVSDNVGINLSSAGVGHQMTVTLDGMTTFTDVATAYTPSSDGSPSGTISYALENLAPGAHTLALRVFDTSGNFAARELDLMVDDDVAPRIFEVFSDANPASTAANFYVRHDRPENIVEVTVTVYDLLGHPVWSGSGKGMSDGNLSTPVAWDLTDFAGRRVARGIYLYRATITTDNDHYETSSRRIAVTAM